LQNLALFWVKKTTIFSPIFGENILKIITSVPELNLDDTFWGINHFHWQAGSSMYVSLNYVYTFLVVDLVLEGKK
jgi:hypothetical protein